MAKNTNHFHSDMTHAIRENMTPDAAKALADAIDCHLIAMTRDDIADDVRRELAELRRVIDDMGVFIA